MFEGIIAKSLDHKILNACCYFYAKLLIFAMKSENLPTSLSNYDLISTGTINGQEYLLLLGKATWCHGIIHVPEFLLT